ncbi:response regulator receiver modulated metal dependent phosphohydrolase [Magnetococcus marinus MC-1]|uniref:Response regulator receiver modulated metal dependent phosphohydrolase n=1 Tax=Magnetococcus marinus (strain ATCC BAA-1437 / JCM 17883 / MC-1) TaxID=156889 RepID=A0LC70_MAGMM|nr:two-component system response regulator [Magnetococcus marinus]ABK45563.1 response regulator receiver modulated metal dependent phosphohydrolase [Magnetococcus marinus MC-1]
MKQKILVVDDAPANLRILVESLSDEYSIAAARDGHKAIALANAKHRPDLILLDVMMPGLDGFEVCLKLKADPATWDIPVLFITALNDEENEVRGLTVGGVDFISKPFNPALVKARVRSHLELKSHRDRLEELVVNRTRELLRTQDVTINALASLAETRDPETGGHIKRTQHYVRLLAEQLIDHPDFMELQEPGMINLLYKSSPLHDVGKVGVPDHILLKPDTLTREEFEEMKRHADYGWKALDGAMRELGDNSFLRVAAEISYTHHEKWDGSGYPRGLAGREIPVSGRLMALADVYDALICRRVYKPPFTHEQATEIILQGRGQHFDPNVVDAFLRLQHPFQELAQQYADSAE